MKPSHHEKVIDVEKKKLLLDCDPGHDDAIAMMLAAGHPKIDLLGITVVSGNQTLKKTGKNALHLCEYLKIDVPVCLGSPRPIVRDVEICPRIHGESGLDGVTFPPPKRSVDPRHAVDFIIETLLHSDEKVTCVTTGPMTNLALAMRLEPKITDHIHEVIVMGGSYANGNVTPAAEFNIYEDPEAADIVFRSDVPVTMVGLDVTRQVMALPDIVKRMDSIQNKASELFVKLMKVFNENQRKVFGLPGGPLHDPVTIAYLIDPSVLTVEFVHCSIDLSHNQSYGRTNCDMYDYQHKEKNTYIATGIDVDKFWDLIEDGLSRYDDL